MNIPLFTGRRRRARAKAFLDIYTQNLWGDEESVSGPGSNRERASAFSLELPPLLNALGVRTLLDAPCGDFNWLSVVPLGVEHYTGVDIVPDLIERNRRLYASTTRSFRHLDLVADRLPHADAILCRDCLVHFSLADIRAAVRNFKRSGAVYLLTTTFTGARANDESHTGGWREINLQQPPFNFPPALRLVDEKRLGPDGRSCGKSLGLWKLKDLPR